MDFTPEQAKRVIDAKNQTIGYLQDCIWKIAVDPATAINLADLAEAHLLKDHLTEMHAELPVGSIGGWTVNTKQVKED